MANNCNKTSNNKYFDCPALMSDGRVFTDYRPSSYVNDLIRIENKVYDSYSYRQFLISNGLNIIETNDKYNNLKNGCDSCSSGNVRQVPNEATCIYNKQFGLCMPNNTYGLGQNNYASPFEPNEAYNPGYQVKQPVPMGGSALPP